MSVLARRTRVSQAGKKTLDVASVVTTRGVRVKAVAMNHTSTLGNMHGAARDSLSFEIIMHGVDMVAEAK